MKFICIDGDEQRLTEGNEYHGQFIVKSESRSGSPSWQHEIKIIVWDDRGQWAEYHKSRFKPAEE